MLLLSLVPSVLGLIVAAVTGQDATPWVVSGLLTPTALATLYQTGFVVRGKTHDDMIARFQAEVAHERQAREQAEERERKLRDATEERIIPTQLAAIQAQQRSTEVLERALVALAKGER